MQKTNLCHFSAGVSNRVSSQPQLIHQHMKRIVRLWLLIPHKVLTRRYTQSPHLHVPVIPTTRAIQHALQLLHLNPGPAFIPSHKHRHLLPPQHVHQRQVLDRTVSNHHRYATMTQSIVNPRDIPFTVLEQTKLANSDSLLKTQLIQRLRIHQKLGISSQFFDQTMLFDGTVSNITQVQMIFGLFHRRVGTRKGRRQSDVLMGDKFIWSCRKTGDLNRVFLQLKYISVRTEAKTFAGDVKMIGAKSAVPKREVVSKGIDKTREGARGDVYRGEGDEKEVGLLWV